MNLIIDAELSTPPSEVGAFRTVICYAHNVLHYEIFAEIFWRERDYYHRWFKRNYLYDYLELVEMGELGGKRISPPFVDRIVCENCWLVIGQLG